MNDQVLGVIVMMLVFFGTVAGASYVFAWTAERDPERLHRSGHPTSAR
jgi:hypothetical protein